MEGLSPAQSWVSTTSRLKVPYLRASPPRDLPPSASFYDFPRHDDISWTDDSVDLGKSFQSISSLTSFLQSWLFFQLLSAFLDYPVDCNDFVTDGSINLDQKAVHDHFRLWKEKLWTRSYAKKRSAQLHIQAIIYFALSKSDVFEEAANVFGSRDEDFDCVALSVKVLISLLNSILDDTFSRSTGLWAPWARHAFSSAGHVFTWSRPFNTRVPDFANDYLVRLRSDDIMNYLYGQPRRFLPLPPGDSHGGRAAMRLIELLVDNGWCRYRARQLCHTYDYLALNGIAGLKQPVEDHQQCVQLRRCCAHDLEGNPSSVYQFRHDCVIVDGCEFVRAPMEEISHIIQSGGIPIISMSVDGPLDFKVVRCTPDTTYTAISHVWSDGLGNPKKNALPLCQLLRLRELIHRTYLPEFSPFYDDRTSLSELKSRVKWAVWAHLRPGRPLFKIDRKRVFFWMDTLCIPVCPGSEATKKSRDLRFRAIKQITPVFAGAFNTLVLDRALEDIAINDLNQVSGDEFAALILRSKWMERGWTLEEGSLAQTCVFQLMGKPYEMTTSLSNLLPRVEKQHSPLDRSFINARRSAAMLLRKALLDDKRQISIVPRFSRATRLSGRGTLFLTGPQQGPKTASSSLQVCSISMCIR
jgi:hypothetical protein